MATISISNWLSWCKIYEPTAFASFTEADDFLTEMYNNSVSYVCPLISYLSSDNYRVLLYRYALHLVIVYCSGQDAPLNSLYEDYDIVHAGQGLLSSTSAQGSSSSYSLPDKVNSGDIETIFLWSTPYGKQVEAVFTQLTGVPLCIIQ